MQNFDKQDVADNTLSHINLSKDNNMESAPPKIEKTITPDQKVEPNSTTQQNVPKVDASVYQESLGSLTIRFVVLIVLASIFYYIIQHCANLTTKSIWTIVALVIFILFPRLFYHRYRKVIINEELKCAFKPHGFWQRLIFATRKTLTAPFIVLLTSLMGYYTLMTHSSTGLWIIVNSFVYFILFELILNTPCIAKRLHADKIPSIYPFYRRWISTLLTGLLCFCIGLFFLNPPYNQEEAFRVITMAVSPNLSDADSIFTTVMQSLDITIGIGNYALSFCKDLGPWYLLAKSFLFALPLAILAIHISLCISMLMISNYRLKQIMQKQQWVKVKGNFFTRNWKTFVLPVFLVCFFGGIAKVGYPYYQKVQEQLQKPIEALKVANAERIGTEYYKIGTIKEIKQSQEKAVAELQTLLNNTVNDVNEAYAESLNLVPQFDDWYRTHTANSPYYPNSAKLKHVILSQLNIKKLSTALTNINVSYANDIAVILEELTGNIDQIMQKNISKENSNTITAYDVQELNFINTLKVNDKLTIDLKQGIQVKVVLPNTQQHILADIGSPASLWFKQVSAKSQAVEDELLAQVDNGNQTKKKPTSALQTYLNNIFIADRDALNQAFAQVLYLEYTPIRGTNNSSDTDDNSDQNADMEELDADDPNAEFD